MPGLPKKQRNSTGRYVTTNGYVKVRQDDVVGRDKWILEHRYVMEQVLDRKLLPGENIHHRDGNRQNNAPENLQLWIRPQPTGCSVDDALAWAHEIIERYENA